MSLEESMRSTRVEMQEKLNAAFTTFNEKIAEGAEKIERYGDTLENYKNIIGIVGKDNLGISDEIMQSMREA
jgi:hypothetical protein